MIFDKANLEKLDWIPLFPAMPVLGKGDVELEAKAEIKMDAVGVALAVIWASNDPRAQAIREAIVAAKIKVKIKEVLVAANIKVKP